MGSIVECITITAGRHHFDSRKKVVSLLVATVCIGFLSVERSALALVQLRFPSFAFNAFAVALAVAGFHAARTGKRSILGLYVVCMAVIVGWTVFWLIIGGLGDLLSLSLSIVCIGLWWSFNLPFVMFAALAVGASAIGVHATYNSHRPPLFVYVLGVVVILGFSAGLFVLALVMSSSLNRAEVKFLVGHIFDFALLLIEGFSVQLAYSLTKKTLDTTTAHLRTHTPTLEAEQLPPTPVVDLSNGALESTQQEFAFSDGAGVVEMQPAMPITQQDQMLAAQEPVMVVPGVMGVYNTVTADTCGLPWVGSQRGPYGQEMATFIQK